MTTIRLTMAQALVRFLAAQSGETDGVEHPLFAGVFAIFGHGNVAGLGEALYAAREQLPTLRAQDEQAEAYDYPEEFFAPRWWRVRRPPPDPVEVGDAVAMLSRARAPLIIAGGGVHYALAAQRLAEFAERHDIPVAETQAGKGA